MLTTSNLFLSDMRKAYVIEFHAFKNILTHTFEKWNICFAWRRARGERLEEDECVSWGKILWKFFARENTSAKYLNSSRNHLQMLAKKKSQPHFLVTKVNKQNLKNFVLTWHGAVSRGTAFLLAEIESLVLWISTQSHRLNIYQWSNIDFRNRYWTSLSNATINNLTMLSLFVIVSPKLIETKCFALSHSLPNKNFKDIFKHNCHRLWTHISKHLVKRNKVIY